MLQISRYHRSIKCVKNETDMPSKTLLRFTEEYDMTDQLFPHLLRVRPNFSSFAKTRVFSHSILLLILISQTTVATDTAVLKSSDFYQIKEKHINIRPSKTYRISHKNSQSIPLFLIKVRKGTIISP